MKLTVSTSAVPGDLATKLKTIAETGFSGVELHEPDLTGFAGSPEDVKRRASDLGLSIDVFQPFHDFEGLNGNARAQAFARLDQKLALIGALGAGILLVTTSTHEDASESEDAICADLAELSARCQAAGCRAALLALPWARFIRNDMDALRLIEKVNQPSLGLALNSRISLADGSRPARLRDIPGDKLFHVQLNDTPALNLDGPVLKHSSVLLPGQGELNLAGFVRVIARSGYKGPWSLGQSDNAAPGAYDGYARDGYRALVSLLDEVAQSEPELPAPLLDLPSRIYPSGFEFIEFAVDDASRQTLIAVLSSMCFRKERTHVSKSVELWRQGAVNIVVNSDTGGFAAQAFAEHGPSVCDMGLRVSDAAQTVTRATALGAPIFSQPVGSEELDIPSIKGVGGGAVHFIDEKSDLHRVWDIEFAPVPKTEATPPAGLRRIDHVAQTMRYQEMQSWLTYYTSIFEMEKAPVVDVVDPSGLVLSQALSSPEGEVRLNLNGAGEPRTFAGAFLADQFGAGVQHIAFLTDDIFETSGRLGVAGFERLEMPENYYDDLAVNFGLADDLVARLREGHILYDRDGSTEYFQIYSAPIFQGFFFEIVQRKSGYQGYGARNAPFRLAAQMRHVTERQQT